MDETRYIIVEFEDGLQIIPATWFNGDTSTSIWPSHYKTKLRLNKAVINKELPQEKCDWEELPVIKVFGTANTYSEGLQKLCLAEDTSNVDEMNISSSEIREREKRRRRKKAKKCMSSSEEESYSDKENNVIENKLLPVLPQKQHFVSIKCNDKVHLHSPSTSTEDKSKNKASDKKNSNPSFIQASMSHVEDDILYTDDLKKTMFGKINKILYKLDSIENKFDMLYEKVKSADKKCSVQRSDILLPLCTLTQLTLFEEKLENIKFKEDVFETFQLIGGYNMHVMLRNILRAAIADTLLVQFSWNGKKNKRCFKDLKVTKLIMQIVRTSYNTMTDNDCAEYTSKWLAQATVRIARLRKENKESDNLRLDDTHT